MSASPQPINFFQIRDVGQNIGISTVFLRQHFKHFFRCLIFICGPLVLIAGISNVFYFGSITTMIRLSKMGTPAMPFSYFAYLFLFMVLYWLSYLLIATTVFQYVLIYQERGGPHFSINELRRRVGKNFGSVVLNAFVLSLLFGTAFSIIAGLFAGLAAFSVGFVLIFGFLILIGAMLFSPALIYIFSTVFLDQMYHRAFWSFKSLSAIVRELKGSFWSTWVLVFVAGCCLYIICAIFSIPQFITMFSSLIHINESNSMGTTSYLLTVVSTIGNFCAQLSTGIFYIVMAFNYFSLHEKAHGTGSLANIDQIGQKPDHTDDLSY